MDRQVTATKPYLILSQSVQKGKQCFFIHVNIVVHTKVYEERDEGNKKGEGVCIDGVGNDKSNTQEDVGLLWSKFLDETFNSILAAENQTDNTKNDGNCTKDELVPGLVEETSKTIIKDDGENQNESAIGKGTEK